MAAPMSRQTATTKQPTNQIELLEREDISAAPFKQT
jgi:hypothetical protein